MLTLIAFTSALSGRGTTRCTNWLERSMQCHLTPLRSSSLSDVFCCCTDRVRTLPSKLTCRQMVQGVSGGFEV